MAVVIAIQRRHTVNPLTFRFTVICSVVIRCFGNKRQEEISSSMIINLNLIRVLSKSLFPS